MKRLIAIWVVFAYLFQLFTPLVVLATESEPTVTLVQNEQPVDPPESVTGSQENSQTESTESQVNPSSDEASVATTPQESEKENVLPNSAVSLPEEVAPSDAPSPVILPSSTPSPNPSPTLQPSSLIENQTTQSEPELGMSQSPENVPLSQLDSSPDPSFDTEKASESAVLMENSETTTQSASPSATLLQTGDTLATADVLSISNVSLTNSCLTIQTAQLQGNDNGDFSNVTCTPLPTQEQPNNETVSTSSVNQATESAVTSSTLPGQVQNSGSVANDVNVVADSGSNELLTDGDGTLLTGDAIALVQLQQLLNLALIDSNVMLLLLTILPSYVGDIILPTPEMLAEQSGGNANPGALDANTTAQVQNTVASSANTGGNDAVGSSAVMETGDAYAAANIFTLANSEVSNTVWYLLWLNIAGQWGGYVYSWQEGDSVLQYDPYQTAILASAGEAAQPIDSTHCQDDACTQGKSTSSTITNQVSAQANTGKNTIEASGSAVLQTGRAISLVNLVSLLNSRFINSQVFLGFLNILGDWQGSLRFAYPELAVAISSEKQAVSVGENVAYTVAYTNQGYDRADGVSVAMAIPRGTKFVSASQQPAEQSENALIWDLGSINKGQSGQITVILHVNDWSYLQAEQYSPQRWWNTLVPSVQAAEDTRHFTVSTAITTIDDQSSRQKNQASYTTTVYPRDGANSEPEPIDSQATSPQDTARNSEQQPMQADQGAVLWPVDLEVTNNVASFVYPGDTVQFTVVLRNQGDAPIRQATLRHQIADAQGTLLEVVFPLGDLPAHKEGRLSFGLTVPPMSLASPLELHSQTVLHGKLDTGLTVYSPEKTTNFIVQPRLLNLGWSPFTVPSFPVAQAESGEVLGSSALNPRKTTPATSPWLVFASLGIIYALTKFLKAKLFSQEEEE